MRNVALVAALAFTLACGGKAVIDGDPSGGGGSMSSMNTGGSPPGPTTGGGGTGGTPSCSTEDAFIEVIGDGPDQTFMAAGPDPSETIPTGNLVFGTGPNESLAVRGCGSNNSTNNCIEMLGPDLSFDGALTTEARIEYTSANGIVFIGDFVVMGRDGLLPVGQEITGFYDGQVFASGGADSRTIFGAFQVCRTDDILVP